MENSARLAKQSKAWRFEAGQSAHGKARLILAGKSSVST